MTLWRGELEHFEKFCATLTLDNGRRMRLEPFQRAIMRDYFAGVRESLIIIPKKNGKTTLLAALLVYHLAFVDEARAYVAASSKLQAGILYDQARGFVNRSAALQRRILVRAGTRELRSRRDGGFALVLAADSDTADGVGPTLAIVDELHRAKSLALYDVFRDGLDAREGSMLTITTAGEDEDSPLGVMRSKFLATPGKRVRGRYTYVRSKAGEDCMHEWALRPGDDVEDLELVKSVNPLSSMTIAKLRRRRHAKSMTFPTWKRFACNLWTQSADAAIADVDWAAKARPGLRIPDGSPGTVIGIDLGWTKDYSAFVPIGYGLELDADGLPLEALIDERLRLIPAGSQLGGTVEEGRMTSEELLKGELRELAGLFPGCLFAIDPNADGQSFAQWIVRELCAGDDDRVWEYSQQPAPMAHASMHFSAGLRATEVLEGAAALADDDDVLELEEDEDLPRVVPLYHPDDAELNRHALGAIARGTAGERWRFDKRRAPRSSSTRVRPRPIDGLIGGTLGYRALTAPAPESLAPFVLVA